MDFELPWPCACVIYVFETALPKDTSTIFMGPARNDFQLALGKNIHQISIHLNIGSHRGDTLCSHRPYHIQPRLKLVWIFFQKKEHRYEAIHFQFSPSERQPSNPGVDWPMA
jgi:hypothetical protein